MMIRSWKKVVGIILLGLVLLPIFLAMIFFKFGGALDDLTGRSITVALADYINYLEHERNGPPPFVTVDYVPACECSPQMPLLAIKSVSQLKMHWVPSMSANWGSLHAWPDWTRRFLCSLDMTTGRKELLFELPPMSLSRTCLLVSKDRRAAVLFPDCDNCNARNEIPVRIDLKTKQVAPMNFNVPPSLRWGGRSPDFTSISPDGNEFAVASEHYILICDFDKIVRQLDVSNDVWRVDWDKDRNLIVVETLGSQDHYLVLNPNTLVEAMRLPPAPWNKQTRKDIAWALRPDRGGTWGRRCGEWWTKQDGWFYRKHGEEFERVFPEGSTYTNRTMRAEEAADLW